MSLARAFTTRRSKPVEEPVSTSFIGRAASQRSPNAKPIQRSQISRPVALISTTNMLSYEAPDIVGTSPVAGTNRNTSSTISERSMSDAGDRSARSSTSAQSHRTQDTDATSVDGSSPTSPEPNHLSCYFKTASTSFSRPPSYSNSRTMSRTLSSAHSRTGSSLSSYIQMESPLVPQRAPSHSKHAHVLSHKRSVQRVSGPPSPRSHFFFDTESSPVQKHSSSSHPFGKELEQLNEAAEEFGSAVRDAEADADRSVMLAKGLAQFCAADYMQELSGLPSNTFAQDFTSYQQLAWI